MSLTRSCAATPTSCWILGRLAILPIQVWVRIGLPVSSLCIQSLKHKRYSFPDNKMTLKNQSTQLCQFLKQICVNITSFYATSPIET